MISEQALEEAFPDIKSAWKPVGSIVQIQLKVAQQKTKGGIILSGEAVETVSDNTQLGRVTKVGPLAFKNRTTLELWPEGAWLKVGDYVRIPQYGGDRYFETLEDGTHVTFVHLKDTDFTAILEPDADPRKTIVIKNIR